MNCLEYARLLSAGQGESDAMRAHREQCRACRRLLAGHTAFERELREALEVPVPGGIEDRLLGTVAARAGALAPGGRARRRWLAAAAAGVAAAGVGVYLWADRDDPLALACIQFVAKEETKSIMMGALPRAKAARVLAATLPIERIEALGPILHVAPCPFNGGTAYHVILDLPQGKVTLMVIPDARPAARVRAVGDGLYATVVPLDRGSVGVVGASRALVGSVARVLAAPAA